MIASMITQLMKDASIEELKNAGLSDYYTTHKKGIFPSGANGVPLLPLTLVQAEMPLLT